MRTSKKEPLRETDDNNAKGKRHLEITIKIIFFDNFVFQLYNPNSGTLNPQYPTLFRKSCTLK